ncbi:hypothetical protein KA013_01155 [Patescibacteria group bacterium]|nr:hypothetical protein [Patescibacteria group bacterium]
MTDTPDNNKADYSIVSNTFIEVQQLQAQLDKVTTSIMPMIAQDVLLKEKLSAYETKIEELKIKISNLLISITANRTEEADLKEKINKKLEKISVDPQTYWAQVSTQVQNDLQQNFDIDLKGKIIRNRPSPKKDKISQYLNKLQTVTDEEKIEEFLDMSLDAFHTRDLPVRTYNGLKAAKISNFRQLIE